MLDINTSQRSLRIANAVSANDANDSQDYAITNARLLINQPCKFKPLLV